MDRQRIGRRRDAVQVDRAPEGELQPRILEVAMVLSSKEEIIDHLLHGALVRAPFLTLRSSLLPIRRPESPGISFQRELP
jgi:hypothetical protein